MISLFLLGGLFLGWSFGRNNLSNVFGTAIGTRMVSFRLAVFAASISVILGALFSSAQTTDAMRGIADISSGQGAFLISIVIALTFLLASRFGIPVSIVQSSVGALVGWNVFFHVTNNWSVLVDMMTAWLYCPIVAAAFSMIGFYGLRFLLQYVRIPLLYRDLWVRVLLILSGVYASYFLGANNMPAIVGAYLNVENLNMFWMVLMVSVAVAFGFLMADKRVIATVSTGLFPLSPLEALVVVFSCGLTLYCFSGLGLVHLLTQFHLPTFPSVPVPTSGVLVGSIMGIGFVKGPASIKWGAFSKIIASWFLVPVISGLICYAILAIFNSEGAYL